MTDAERQLIRETVETLRKRIKRYTDRGLGEENTKASLIDPLLGALGWDIHDPDEVHREYKSKPKDKPVDYALKLLRTPQLFIEAKGLGKNISDRRWVSQIISYAAVAGVEWCVLTDGDQYRIYNATAPVDAEDKLLCEITITGTDTARTVNVLRMLSRSSLDGEALPNYWRAHFVDRRVKDALTDMVTTADRSLVRLLRKRVGAPNLGPKDISESLRRLEMTLAAPMAMAPAPAPSPSGKRRKPKGSGRRGKKPRVGGLPTEREMEVPLLRAIISRGGRVSGKAERLSVAQELADLFGLTPE